MERCCSCATVTLLALKKNLLLGLAHKYENMNDERVVRVRFKDTLHPFAFVPRLTSIVAVGVSTIIIATIVVTDIWLLVAILM